MGVDNLLSQDWRRQLENISNLHIYDNTIKPHRIFKKRKDQYFRWPNEFWDEEAIEKLTGIRNYSVN